MSVCAVQVRTTCPLPAVAARPTGATGTGLVPSVLSYAPISIVELEGLGRTVPEISVVGAFLPSKLAVPAPSKVLYKERV